MSKAATGQLHNLLGQSGLPEQAYLRVKTKASGALSYTC